MIWRKAEGCRVTLADGRELLDLTAGFGVAALGHRNPRIAEAWRAQEVVHALGDLADAEVTVRLRDALPRPAKLGVTGEDAVEIALRTALLATGRPGIVAFEGAYHGTGLLALAATGFEQFRAPFAAWLPGPVYRRAYGEDPGVLPEDTACVVVEPVQGRAGSRVPPAGFLETLRRRCDDAGALLVVDAIYAGLGRTGELWPGDGVADVLCVGKALGGGLPLSASGPRTSTRTRTPAARSPALRRSSCSTRFRPCSSVSPRPASVSRRPAGTAAACSGPAPETRRTPSSAACSSSPQASTGR